MEKYELYHHGIKDMKWGIRRFQNKDGSLTPAGRSRYGEKFKNAVKNKVNDKLAERRRKKQNEKELRERAKPARSLTTEELNRRIERLTLEKRYKDLLKDVESTSKGQKVVNKIFEDATENIGKQTVAYLMGTGVNTIAKKVFGASGNIINPKKGQKDN